MSSFSINCDFCLDIGVHCVKFRTDNFETLMLCQCREGMSQTYMIPRWEHRASQHFTRYACPISWFKPDKVSEIKIESLNHKTESWRAKISLAEQYWQNAGKNVS